nr:hypothetical protein [Tanacetum cinerariifolium]
MGDSPKLPQRDQKSFDGGSWSDSEEEEEVKKDEICLMAHESSEIEMDDANITMEEYISLEEEKACRRGKVYNWETATYAMVYNNALTSKSDSSTEPVEIPHRIGEFDLKTKTSLFECDEEKQNILYFNDLFTFNIIHPDDLKSDK